MKRKERGLALLLALLLLVAAGCTPPGSADDGKETGTPVPTQEPTPTPEPEETLDPEVVDQIKYNIYVELNNKMVDVLDTLYDYYEVVEYADEFALLPDSPYSYKYGISGYNTDILENAQYVATLEPAFETLDSLALQLIEPMRALMDTFSEISHNYDSATNQYAKPKEYHKVIQANAALFEALAYQYMGALQEMSNERIEAAEQRMKDEGQLLAYNFSHAITVVKKITAECYSQGVDDYNIVELDLAPIRPLYQELLDTIDAYKAAAGDNNQLMEESMTSSKANDISIQLDRMATALDYMIRLVESGVPISDPGREFLGGLIHVEVVLSYCIDLYNSVFAS